MKMEFVIGSKCKIQLHECLHMFTGKLTLQICQHMEKMAKMFLAIYATSAPIERVFNQAGNI